MKKINLSRGKKLIVIVGVAVISIGGIIVGKSIGINMLAVKSEEEFINIDLYTIPGKEKVYISGKIIPKKSQDFLLSAEDGEVEKINVKDGEGVKKGALLYSTKNSEKLKEIEELKKRLNTKKIELSVSEEELKSAINSEISDIEGEIKLLSDLAYKKVYAPFEGKVYINDENNSTEGSLAIMTLESKDYYIKGSVNEMDLLKLAEEREVKINILSSKAEAVGKISYLGERPLDGSSDSSGYGQSTMSQYAVKIDVEDQSELRNGFNVQAIAEFGQPEKKIPTTAVIEENGKKFIFKIENDIAIKTEIAVKEGNSEFTVVTEGINEGDNIARDGYNPVLIDGKNIYEIAE